MWSAMRLKLDEFVKVEFIIKVDMICKRHKLLISPAIQYSKGVVPAKAGTQVVHGCRIKSGMPEMSLFSCRINKRIARGLATAGFIVVLVMLFGIKTTLSFDKWKDSIASEWGGHLRTGVMASSVDARSVFGAVGAGTYVDGETDFRLKSKTYAGDIYSFECHYEAVLRGGDTREKVTMLNAAGVSASGSALIAPSIVSDKTSLMSLSGVIDEGDNYIAYHRLDRLVLAAQPDWGTAAVGRQALTWGNGLIFNPMDLFNPFRPTDMERDYKIGADMALLQVQSGKIDEIQMVYVPRRNPETGDVSREQSSLAGKFHKSFDDFDIDLMAATHYGDFVAGFGGSAALGGAVWRFDATWTQPGDSQANNGFFACVTNLDYAWTWQGKNLYGLLEFYYNGLGKSDYADAFSDSDMLGRLKRGELFTLGKTYMAGRIQLELHPLVNLYMALINNMADPSGILQPRMEWSVKQNVQIVLSGTTHYGRSGTEYGGFYIPEYGVWKMPVDNVYCRVSLFF